MNNTNIITQVDYTKVLINQDKLEEALNNINNIKLQLEQKISELNNNTNKTQI